VRSRRESAAPPENTTPPTTITAAPTATSTHGHRLCRGTSSGAGVKNPSGAVTDMECSTLVELEGVIQARRRRELAPRLKRHPDEQ
jgi:hypothetical protein